MSLDALGTSPLLSLIGWTTVSAFTGGAAAAALVILVKAIAPRIAPKWGHRLVLSLYALSLIAALVVAAMPRRPPTAAAIQPALPLAAVLPVPPGPFPLTAATQVRPSDAAAVIVGLFGVLAVALALFATGRLCVGLIAIRRLWRNAAAVIDPSALAIVESVARHLGVRHRVVLRESTQVDTAITGGLLKPFILLPPGLIEELGSEIEPVFAHELAHVRRHDFAVALAQAITDGATMLSPGHRWLSLEASRLREQACDDVVVSIGIEPLRYARVLEALGRRSGGLPVTAVVCAANRHLSSRVRRLIHDKRSTVNRLAVAGAALALCAAAAATSVVASAAPGLPLPSSDAHPALVPALLIAGDAASGTQRKSGVTVDYYYNPEASGPFRVSELTFRTNDSMTATIRSVYPKRIVALALGREARRSPALTAGDQFVERSAVVPVAIDPGQSSSASLVFPPITLSSLFMGPKAEGSRVQAQYYPAYARFEDGTEWSGGAAVAQILTIPRALVSRSAPEPVSASEKIWVCYDAEGHQTSEGGIAPVREDEAEWVRCTNGRWISTKSPVPAGAKFTPAPVH